MPELRARVLAPGSAAGSALVLGEPLSFWGGVDPDTGRIVDRRHPQAGTVVTRRVLVMPSGRGSSSSSTVLAECIRIGSGPAAVVLRDPDPILALGALVADELYGRRVPVIVVGAAGFGALRTGDHLDVQAAGREGTLRLRSPEG